MAAGFQACLGLKQTSCAAVWGGAGSWTQEFRGLQHAEFFGRNMYQEIFSNGLKTIHRRQEPERTRGHVLLESAYIPDSSCPTSKPEPHGQVV